MPVAIAIEKSTSVEVRPPVIAAIICSVTSLFRALAHMPGTRFSPPVPPQDALFATEHTGAFPRGNLAGHTTGRRRQGARRPAAAGNGSTGAATVCEVQTEHWTLTMAENMHSKTDNTLDQFTGKRGTGGPPQRGTGKEDFPGDFERLKRAVIRPVFETIGNGLKERGHEFNIAEEPDGKISIHIVPAGVKKSIHPYDWFPTFSLFGSPDRKIIGLHGRNMRPNSEPSSGSRGEYQPTLVSKEIVEKELMKFIGEIANW
jgi:hypothetical protein